MKKHTHTCPMCDSQKIEIRHDRNMRYRYLKKDHVLVGQEHTVCLDCGQSFYFAGQIERNNERFAEFEKAIVKAISPNEIRSLREKYMLSQEQATRIFECGPTAFSKWERGEVAPTATAALLLRGALEDPEIMQKFADRANVKIDLSFVMAETSDILKKASNLLEEIQGMHAKIQAREQTSKDILASMFRKRRSLTTGYSMGPVTTVRINDGGLMAANGG